MSLSQAGLHIEFQASQSYPVTLSQKIKQKENSKGVKVLSLLPIPGPFPEAACVCVQGLCVYHRT